MLRIRRAIESDKRDLWAWRNDPASVAASSSSSAVPWPAHSAWFDSMLGDSSRILYIGELDSGEKVGMCRFDLDEAGSSAEISINLNPAHRGKKLSPPLLTNSIQAFRKEFGELPLTATIRADNAASIRLFAAAGFRQTGTDDVFGKYALISAE